MSSITLIHRNCNIHLIKKNLYILQNIQHNLFSTFSTHGSICHRGWSRHLQNSVKFYSTGRSKVVTFYDILEIKQNASQKQIKAAYFRLSKKLHPDVNTAPDAKERFAMLSEAYEVLGNRRTRSLYDAGSLSPSDLRSGTSGTASDPGPVDEEYRDFFKRKGAPFRTRTGAPPTGKTQIYDFDEFYRQHYGDAIRKNEERRRAQEEMEMEDRINAIKLRRRLVMYCIGVLVCCGFAAVYMT